MTALAMMIQPDDYVILACDGVSTSPSTGAVGGYMSKLHFLPHLDLAIATAGFGGLAEALTFHLPTYVTDFDDLIKIMPEYLPWLWAEVVTTPSVTAWDSCIALAGWSAERKRYEGFRYSTTEWGEIDQSTGETVRKPAFTPRRIPEQSVWTTCGFSEERLRAFGVIDPPEGTADEDLVVRTICAARAESGHIEGQSLRFNAGGFVQVAQIARGFARTNIAHRWPEDVLGEPVDPSRGQPLPNHLMPLRG